MKIFEYSRRLFQTFFSGNTRGETEVKAPQVKRLEWIGGYDGVRCHNYNLCGDRLTKQTGAWGLDQPAIVCCSVGCAKAVFSRYSRGVQNYIRNDEDHDW